jgi:preprotein translocase subunit SecE
MLKETKIYKFYEQVRQEANKVIWPTKKELTTSTGIVIIAVSVFSLVCLILDYGIHALVQLMLSIG